MFLIFHVLTIVFLCSPFCLFSPWKTLVPLVRREHFSCFTTHLSNFCFAPSRKTIQLSFRTNLFYSTNSTTTLRCTWKPRLMILKPNFDFFIFKSKVNIRKYYSNPAYNFQMLWSGMDAPPRGEGWGLPIPPRENDQNRGEVAGQNQGPNSSFLQ